MKKPGRLPAAPAAPPWLAEVVRPAPAPVPWPAVIRAALAVCGPLALGMAVGDQVAGLLGAMGGLLGSVVDRGGTYPARIRRIAVAGIFGGAAGLMLGVLVHGRGWIALGVLVAVAGLSALMTAAGATLAITGLQLLVYTILGTGPLGAARPWWWPPLLLLAGVGWAILLLVPAWLVAPLAAEQRSTAEVYRALARMLRAAGTPDFPAAHQAVVGALNQAWDDLASRRARISGRDPELNRIAALLRQTHPLTEAAVTLVQEGAQAPPQLTATIEAIADAIQYGTPVTSVRPAGGPTPGSRALAAAVAGAADLASGKRPAEGGAAPSRPDLRERVRDALAETVGGRLTRIFALRLMLSIGVAGLASQALPLQRSYWVVLTVAIVLRPDFGSVFARALQRGIGTIVGAVLGAVILIALPPGPLLLIPCAIFAGLLPYGRDRNWGLFSTFLTPLVVILIDLLVRSGWSLALDRLIDTVLGCAIVLLVGYAPWPSSWHAHLPDQLATALDSVARYTEQALAGAPGRSALRRQTYRVLSDLRTEFQRTMAEPPSVSRRAARLWPVLTALEQLTDTVTATAVRADVTGRRPGPRDVAQLAGALRSLARGVRDGQLPADLPLPGGEDVRQVADRIADVRRALTGEHAA
ncbi:MAG: hypothetical protein QOG05_5619 [Streptosporangiaceae bacterium]|nr:hypothetical protein [Streptosporangiaceae bacterium]